MAAEKGERESRRQKRSESSVDNHIDYDDDEEPDFSDPEDYVDDISDEDLLGDLLKNKPKDTDSIDNVIIVDNIPVVGQERLPKLQNVIKKIYEKFGRIVNDFYPMGSDEKTKGYLFIEYSNPQSALDAVKSTNGYKLDKAHTFAVNLFSDYDKFEHVPDDWEPPQAKPYKDLGNLRYWLQDPDCFDHYSVIYEGGEKTAIFQNTVHLSSVREPTKVEERARWTETYVRWSPQGTYLATLHQKGIALWGGPKFDQIMRFSHPGVQLIDFSPCERFLITFSPVPVKSEEPQSIVIFDIRTGQRKRGFNCESHAQATWPIFKWSSDGKFFARLAPDTLSVYETNTFRLLDNKSLKIEGIRDFSWSPSDNYLAYWVPEQNNIPARVTIISMPARAEMCVRNLFNVADCRMHWQKNGDFLCVKVDRYSKARKAEDTGQWKYSGIYYNFELFRIREKQIPVDKVECKETFERRTANHLFWSPTGQFIVLAGLRNMNGVLEFIDTADMTVMAQTEHFMATDVEWDPTGRYVITGVSWWGHKVDNGYWLWSFQGRLLQKQQLDRFCQLLWRPRPPTLLSVEEIKEIKKNLKKYSQRFEAQDRLRQSTVSTEILEKRRQLMLDYERYRQQMEDEFLSGKQRRIALRDGVDTDELDNLPDDEYDEEVVEFLLKVEEIILDEE
ncbi:eukaryotic translation initiation factor 3 subunit B-like isoform X2 [Mercenaria mercenaria]|uniref:eukaryotic translation initiation factor 3 subunit B-like isoform X2 n=1 Tax=Mercenaria mercenaria TaxID=6596 RepID=UPI00234F888B|nr:eukaryotic translation initiation factor 3 subunit B-like isoform X2 [Mercenaria mercenaria]